MLVDRRRIATGDMRAASIDVVLGQFISQAHYDWSSTRPLKLGFHLAKTVLATVAGEAFRGARPKRHRVRAALQNPQARCGDMQSHLAGTAVPPILRPGFVAKFCQERLRFDLNLAPEARTTVSELFK